MMHEILEEDYIEHKHEHVDITGPFQINCAFCNGTGVHPGTMNSLQHNRCPVCRGEGILKYEDNRNQYRTCTICEGSGKEPGITPIIPCRTCKGHGIK